MRLYRGLDGQVAVAQWQTQEGEGDWKTLQSIHSPLDTSKYPNITCLTLSAFYQCNIEGNCKKMCIMLKKILFFFFYSFIFIQMYGAALDSHFDLWAGCRRPAFLVCVQVFREQAPDEGTAGACVTIVFVNFAYFQKLQHQVSQSWNHPGKLTIHCFAWAQWGQGRARPGSSHRSRWYRRTPEKTTDTIRANRTTAYYNKLIHWFESFLPCRRSGVWQSQNSSCWNARVFPRQPAVSAAECHPHPLLWRALWRTRRPARSLCQEGSVEKQQRRLKDLRRNQMGKK